MSSTTASENGSARATPKDSDDPTTRKQSERIKPTPPKSPATSRCDSLEAAASTSTPSSKYKAIEKVATPPPLPESRPSDPSTYEHERDGNELKVCQFVQYDSSNKALAPIIIHNWRATDPVPTTAVPQPIYRMRTFPLVEIGAKRLLFHVAKSVAQHGKLFMILPILLVALSFIGPLYYRDRITLHAPFGTFLIPNNDPTTTVPVSSIGARSANGYRSPRSSPFNGTNPQFDTPDRNLYSHFSVLLSTRSPYGSVLSNHSLSTYNTLVDAIHNITLVQSSFSLKWPDVCRSDCSDTNPIMRYLQERRLFLKYPEALATFETGEPKHTYIANLIGDVDLDSEGIVSRARSILLTLRLKDNLRTEVFDNFDRQLQDTVAQMDKEDATGGLRFRTWSLRQFVVDVESTLHSLHGWLGLNVIVLVAFCVLVSIRRNAYRSRPLVGLHTALVILFGCAVFYSIQITNASGAANALVYPALFIITGVTMLLFSSMQETWARYSMAALHPKEKFAFLFCWDGPCMALTFFSLASSYSFSVGTGLVSYYWDYCLYIQYTLFSTAAGLTAILVLGLLYMAVAWYNAGRREAEGLKWFQMYRQGDHVFYNKCILDYDEITANMLHEKLADLKPCFARNLGKFVTSPQMRAMVFVATSVYLAFAIYAASSTAVEMHEEDFLAKNSSSAQFLAKYRSAYGKTEDFLEVVFESPIEYYDQRRREDIFSMIRWVVDNDYVGKVTNWLTDFDRFQHNTVFDITPDTLAAVTKIVFLNVTQHKKYSTDILFDKYETQILKSRLYMQLTPKGRRNSQYVIRQLLASAKQVHLPVSVNAPFAFMLHRDLEVTSEISSMFCTWVALVFVVLFFVFNHPCVSFVVLLSCVSVTVGVFGYSNYVMLPLNIVTLTTILLGNLLTAAVAVHFCYSFYNAGPTQNRNVQRIQYAFQCSLWPTIIAYLSVIVVFSPLLLSDVPIVLHVMKALTAICTIGFLHFVFVLPVATICLSETLICCCTMVTKVCDENGCCGVEQPVESIYFVPASANSLKAINSSYLGTAANGTLAVRNGTLNRRMIMAPAPPDYPAGSAMLIPETVTVQSPASRRRARTTDTYRIRESAGSVCESVDSRDNQIDGKRRQQPRTGSRHQTPRRERRSTEDRRFADDSLDSPRHEEQIYEEPESPTILPRRMHARDEPSMHRTSRFRGLPRDEFFRMDYNDLRRQRNEAALDMQPNWRQYLIDGTLGAGSPCGPYPPQLPPPLPYTVSSPSYQRRRFV